MASYQSAIHLISKWDSQVTHVFAKITGPRTEIDMDTPINIQEGTRDLLDEPAAALFQQQWQLYRKFVENNYFYHHEVYARLHRILVDEAVQPFRFLDIACLPDLRDRKSRRGGSRHLASLEAPEPAVVDSADTPRNTRQ